MDIDDLNFDLFELSDLDFELFDLNDHQFVNELVNLLRTSGSQTQ